MDWEEYEEYESEEEYYDAKYSHEEDEDRIEDYEREIENEE